MSYIVCINFSALERGSVSLFFISCFATLMTLVLIYWPIFIALMTYKALKQRPCYPIFLESGIEVFEGGEPEEEE